MVVVTFSLAHASKMPSTIRRTLIISALACAASGFSFGAASVRRIGFLSNDAEGSRAGVQAKEFFPRSIEKAGFAPQELHIDWRWGEGLLDRLPALATELVRSGVEVIVARTNAPVLAAKAATQSIPIVMLNGNFPVETGLVSSYAHPGGNVTGTAYASPETMSKLVQLLVEAAPGRRNLAVLTGTVSSESRYFAALKEAVEQSSRTYRLSSHYFSIPTVDDADSALAALARSGADLVLYAGSSNRTAQDRIFGFVRKLRLPSVSALSGFADVGGLIHLAPDVTEYFDQTASYVARILKGARPGDLPVLQPSRFELAINIAVAHEIGLTIPQSLLGRADRLIS
jgi:putative ABC transport system substrate-binding protein